MSGTALGAIFFASLLGLLVLRVPIGIAMFVVGVAGYSYQTDLNIALHSLEFLAYARLSNYDLTVIPLFLLMGQFSTHGRLSQGLFRCVTSWTGHLQGGTAMATIGACAGFGAICGSSLATAATMGQVALPELRRQGYSHALSTGCLAAGGTLGILIPPSMPLVIYAILTQESIGKLFAAAFVPGLMAMIGYVLVIRLIVTINPQAGPAGLRSNWSERFQGTIQALPVLLVFVLVVVGIYGGWANPTEAAAIGAASCGCLAAMTGKMGWRGFLDSALGTAQASAMIFLVLLGADTLNAALALTQMPVELAAWVQTRHLSPILIMSMILLIYIALGCMMDSLAMILLTIPIFYPVVMGLNFTGMTLADQSVWFGILALTVVEIGLIHPPVGMNVYIIHRMAENVPLTETFKGVIPFLLSDLVRIALLLLYPALSLFTVHAL